MKISVLWAAYVGQAAVIVAVLWIGLRLSAVNIEIPFSLTGDALHHLAITKAIIESGWWWHISRLSAPFGLDMVMFPVGGTLDYVLIKLLAFGSDKPGTVLNLFWILSCVLSGMSATWGLQLLGISRLVSFVVGLLFAFLPHAFFRNINHLMLVYYLVPLASTLAILILKGDFERLPNRDKVILYLGCVGLGLNYVYTAFFSCFVFAVVAGLGLFGVDRQKTVYPAIRSIAIITTATLLNLLPSVYAWHADRDARSNISQKSLADADTYGLKLRHLVTPIPDHPLPLWRKFEAKTASANFPLETENTTARLGTIGSIGMLILLGISLLGALRPKWLSDVAVSLQPVASLNLAVFLLATIGGFGSIFNVVVSPEIRAFNRAAVFIAFFSFTAVGILLTWVEKKCGNARRGQIVFTLSLLLLTTAGIFDQAPFGHLRAMHDKSRESYSILQPFVQRLDRDLGNGAMVFELPYAPYPHTPQIHKMRANQHLVPYVLSEHLEWSWPSLSSQAMKVSQRLANDSLPDFVKNLAIVGYGGAWVDKFGYEDQGNSVIKLLTAEAGSTPLVSSDGRYVLVSLRGLKDKLTAEMSPSELEKRRFQLLRPTLPRALDGPLPESAFKAFIRVERMPSSMRAGQLERITVTVKNLGNSVFSSNGVPGGKHAVVLAYRWLSGSTFVTDYGTRTLFPDELHPNEEITLNLPVQTPTQPGKYVLEFDLVQELVAWFKDRGSHPAQVAVHILP